MIDVLLLQLPIPQLNYGARTGNIPLAAACLKQAAGTLSGTDIEILPESISSYIGDGALIQTILKQQPDIVGFTLFNWNIRRSIHVAEKIKEVYSPKIVFGGPEVTPDNSMVHSVAADFFVYGEGESVFKKLLENDDYWDQGKAKSPADSFFTSAVSPYRLGFLEPQISNMMYLETQRGCPYRCGFCYYNKSRNRICFADSDAVVGGVQWAIDNDVKELCLLDPSLNSRPDLNTLLIKIGRLNRKKRLTISAEIRAEMIDAATADLFADAGFDMFEIGLQSTNPKALEIMNRPTNMRRFVEGATLLKQREILPRIDLIVGLPGDSPDGFKRSVDFLADHNLFDDIQVFPLSILPGTDFKVRSKALGLESDRHPPYHIKNTPTFSGDKMLQAFDYAEQVFNLSLFPDPDLDISLYDDGGKKKDGIQVHTVKLQDNEYVYRLILCTQQPLSGFTDIAIHLTHPYQIIIGQNVNDREYINKVVALFTLANPFTPFELVFIEPAFKPDVPDLLSHMQIERPHYLDNDLRFLYDQPGNRCVLFTLVSKDDNRRFYGEMKRQVFWWKMNKLPEPEDVRNFSDLDGLLIDSPVSSNEIHAWQDRFAGHADEIILVSFADAPCQNRWRKLTASDRYY